MQGMLESFIPAVPLLVILLGGIISIVLEAVLPRLARPVAQATWSALIIVIALAATIYLWADGFADFGAVNALALDRPTWVVWSLLLIFALGSVALFAERKVYDGQTAFAAAASTPPGSQAERSAISARQEHSEVFGLMLFSLSGMMIFVAANDLLTMFVGLEILSLPLYVLCSLARRRRLLSQESSLKYFLLGSLSSALFLYGVALIYGYAGGFGLTKIGLAQMYEQQSPWLLLAGLGLVCVGVTFKMGAVPFHNWVPDVYQGAPTPVTAFMAVCTKIAAVFGLTRLLYVGLGALAWDWQVLLAVIAVATMFIGSAVALWQNDVKRLLAYSAIAHAGFILVGMLGAVAAQSGLADGHVGSYALMAFYLGAYGFATLGAFAILTMVRRGSQEATGFDAWAGLGRRSPLLAILMTIFLLSMAGIPLTGGFVGKLLVFTSAWRGGFEWLVCVAVMASVLAMAFYFKLIAVMFGREPAQDDVAVAPAGIGTQLVIWIGVLGTVVLGVAPGPLLDLLASSTDLLILPLR